MTVSEGGYKLLYFWGRRVRLSTLTWHKIFHPYLYHVVQSFCINREAVLISLSGSGYFRFLIIFFGGGYKISSLGIRQISGCHGYRAHFAESDTSWKAILTATRGGNICYIFEVGHMASNIVRTRNSTLYMYIFSITVQQKSRSGSRHHQGRFYIDNSLVLR